MASTFVDICNSALIRIGVPTITSFQDGNAQANACNVRYQEDRDIVLRMHPWTCATKRVILSPSTTAPAFGWQYAFPLPADYLRIDDISNQPWGTQVYLGSRPPYAIESGSILFGWNTLYLRYISQVQNAAQLDAECANAIALYIAYDLAQLLLQNQTLVKELNEEFGAALATARNVSAQEQDTCLIMDTFDRARFSGPS
jgi:hypothetical protein